MLKKTGKKWNFESEKVLEDFVWIHLNTLLKLSPLERQYAVNGDICDILVLDNNGGLVVMELKNKEDRYIVQQLTRYCHSLISEKPSFKQPVNYDIPIRLIAIAPSFHHHNWIDREYHKLNIEFVSFTLNQSHNEVYLQLQNEVTQKVSQIKVIDLLSKDNKLREDKRVEITETGSITCTKALDDMLKFYVFKNAHKLGIPDLEPSEMLRLNSMGYRAKGSKVFKIRVKEKRAKSGFREVSIRVPSSVRVGEFVIWVRNNVPTAIGIISPSGGHY